MTCLPPEPNPLQSQTCSSKQNKAYFQRHKRAERRSRPSAQASSSNPAAGGHSPSSSCLTSLGKPFHIGSRWATVAESRSQSRNGSRSLELQAWCCAKPTRRCVAGRTDSVAHACALQGVSHQPGSRFLCFKVCWAPLSKAHLPTWPARVARLLTTFKKNAHGATSGIYMHTVGHATYKL